MPSFVQYFLVGLAVNLQYEYLRNGGLASLSEYSCTVYPLVNLVFTGALLFCTLSYCALRGNKFWVRISERVGMGLKQIQNFLRVVIFISRKKSPENSETFL